MSPSHPAEAGAGQTFWARIGGWSCLGLATLGLALGAAGCSPFSQSFYPVGIYGVGTTNALEEAHRAGFNAVAGPADRSFLDAAAALGMKVLASPGTAAGDHFDAAAARRTVQAFDSHPALWAWYLVDEPDFNWVPPGQVLAAQTFLKNIPAHKPTALVLFDGKQALDYANIADITLVDRYPVPWLPLANFAQHVRLARLALGPGKPLLAVVQAFSWSAYPELLPEEKNFRPPTYDELRSMTYSALVERANGIFYYTYDGGRWKIRDHPETWAALNRVVAEVNQRRPLFKGEHPWWAFDHRYRDPSKRFNGALASAVSPALVQVKNGNSKIPPGQYIVAVNTTPLEHDYRLRLPGATAQSLPVLDENRSVSVKRHWLEDHFAPFAVHVYGPAPEGTLSRNWPRVRRVGSSSPGLPFFRR